MCVNFDLKCVIIRFKLELYDISLSYSTNYTICRFYFFSFFFYGQRICIHQNVLINPVFVQQSVSHKREVNHTRLIMCDELNLENVGKTIQTRAYNIELFLFHQLDCLNQIILIRSYQLNSKWLIRCFVDKIHMYLNLLKKKKSKVQN